MEDLVESEPLRGAGTLVLAPRRSCGRTKTATQPSAKNSDVMSHRGAGRQADRQMSRVRAPAAVPAQMTASTLSRVQPCSASTASGV